MTSKYGVAKEVIAQAKTRAQAEGLDPADVLEATVVSLVQELKDASGPGYVRGVLQYEIDSLGSGGVYEIARGGGHS